MEEEDSSEHAQAGMHPKPDQSNVLSCYKKERILCFFLTSKSYAVARAQVYIHCAI